MLCSRRASLFGRDVEQNTQASWIAATIYCDGSSCLERTQVSDLLRVEGRRLRSELHVK